MKNLFYDLPTEIIRIIYEYDNTYREIFDKILMRMPKYIKCEVRNQYTNEIIIYEYNNIYNYFYNRAQTNLSMQIIKQNWPKK